jgi:outer membrane immunogenic protein
VKDAAQLSHKTYERTLENRRVNKLLLGLVPVLMLMNELPSRAADLSTLPVYKSPAVSPGSTDHTWTGFYVGVNAGYGWGASELATTTALVPNGYFLEPSVAQIAAAGSATVHPSGFVGGFQGGYNVQISQSLVGFEVEFDSFHITASRTVPTVYQAAPPFAFTLHGSTSTDWLFTARPRIGWVSNNFLAYATGGIALTSLRTDNSFGDNFVGPPPSGAMESANAAGVKLGWTIGAGVEYAFLDHWSIKGEYLYADFGSVSTAGVLGLSPAYVALFPGGIVGNPFSHTADLRTSIARLGLNYRF